MIIRKLRLDKGWSQEQLAELCDISARTVQRIEKGQKPSLETLKALAAVFEINISDLKTEADMSNQTEISTEEEKTILYERKMKGFRRHFIQYAVVMMGLFILNAIKSPNHYWVIWPALGWGVGVLFHGLNAFNVFNFSGSNEKNAKWAAK
ncbi:XRE family transcriptional regulator [Candidatus Desulfarcum epimagneticum]|uniref:XRE family transcriptional regulator n=1 Tax=uncultured Desulfobacteraceae bacterium TaxID=218296 RepID=A0A484HBN1_9BACT|nr:XRE family transcriptional regulator [uncultured Desulfobacteraceae bacterium]